MRWQGWFVLVMGLMFAAIGLVDLLNHRLGGLAVIYLVEGAVGLAAGAVGVVWWVPRQTRRRLEQVVRMNGNSAAR